MICPKCKGKAAVTHTEASDDKMETVRYHLCKECDNKFITIERLPSGWKYEQKYEDLIKAIKQLVQDYEQ